MIDILSATVPIFLIVAVGFVTTRLGMFGRADMSVFSTYVIKIALPPLIFVNVAGRSLGEILNPTYLLGYAVAAMAMAALGQLWGRLRRVSRTRAAMVSFALSGTNNGFVGFPIFLLMLPQVAGLAIGMDMLVDNTLIIPVALILLESAAGRDERWSVRIRGITWRVVTHPLVIAIVAAVVVGAVGLRIPPMIFHAVELLANSSSAVALFSIGGMLVGLRIGGGVADLAFSVLAKLLGMPALAIGLAVGLPLLGLPPLAPQLRAAFVLTCALPSVTVLAPLGEQFGEGDFGAATMMTSTVVSFFTITGWMVALSAVGWL